MYEMAMATARNDNKSIYIYSSYIYNIHIKAKYKHKKLNKSTTHKTQHKPSTTINWK